MRIGRTMRAAGLAVCVALTLGSLQVAAAHGLESRATPQTPVPSDPMTRATALAQHALDARSGLAAKSTATAPHASAWTSTPRSAAAGSDPADVALPPGDISEVGARSSGQSVRLSARLPQTVNPRTDERWRYGDTGLTWLIDAGSDGTIENYGVLFTLPTGRLVAVILANKPGYPLQCTGNATYGAGLFTMTVPASCLGSSAAFGVAVAMDFDTMIYDAGIQGSTDYAPDDGLVGPVSSDGTAARPGGGYVVGSDGGIHAFNIGGSPRPATAVPLLANARGIATTPDGGGGWVLDGTGTLYPFGTGPNEPPPSVYGATLWPNRDVARGVAIRANGKSGFVVDWHGGLHQFGIGTTRSVPALFGVQNWSNDNARGVALLPNNSGGFVLDASGALHWFSIGTDRPAPALFGVAVSPGLDVARGVAVVPNGSGGFIVDRFGGLHWFSIGKPRNAQKVTGGPVWSSDAARGVSVSSRPIAVPDGGPDPFVPIAGKITDVVIDGPGHFAYATNETTNSVAVVDLATRTVVATIPVGKEPTSLDLTPDGTRLYVANHGAPAYDVSVVDVANRVELRRIAVPQDNVNEDQHPLSIAIAANGVAFLTTSYGCSGVCGELWQIDLATDAISRRMDMDPGGWGNVDDGSLIKGSADRTKLVIAEGSGSTAAVYTYSAATDSFSVHGPFVHLVHATFNADGSLMLIDGSLVYDTVHDVVLGRVPGTAIGGALAHTATLGVRATNHALQTFATDSLFVHFDYDLGDSATWVYRSLAGRVVLTPDDHTAVVTTDHGLSVVSL